MNVLITNKYHDLLTSLDIDIIKTMNGEFDVDEIITTFSNFFYNKMILDITSIRNYRDFNNLQKLAANIDPNKLILFLDDSVESLSPSFFSKLVSIGIYSFSSNIENVRPFIEKPNTFEEVSSLLQNRDIKSAPLEGQAMGQAILQETGVSLKVIGFKNITTHAGSSSLIYMLKHQLQRNYRVLAIEIDKHDFALFNDEEMISVAKSDFTTKLSESTNYDVILVDLNDSNENESCDDVIFLIEPSTIKLNRLIRRNRNIFNELKGKKLVLNQSLLAKKDIQEFSYEAKANVFYNIPPLDDKVERHQILDEFLNSLGFIKQTPDNNSKQKGIFNF